MTPSEELTRIVLDRRSGRYFDPRRCLYVIAVPDRDGVMREIGSCDAAAPSQAVDDWERVVWSGLFGGMDDTTDSHADG